MDLAYSSLSKMLEYSLISAEIEMKTKDCGDTPTGDGRENSSGVGSEFHGIMCEYLLASLVTTTNNHKMKNNSKCGKF